MTALLARPAIHALLADGTTVRIRAVEPEDRDQLHRLYEEMSPENLRMRLFAVSPGSDASLLRSGAASHPSSRRTRDALHHHTRPGRRLPRGGGGSCPYRGPGEYGTSVQAPDGRRGRGRPTASPRPARSANSWVRAVTQRPAPHFLFLRSR